MLTKISRNGKKKELGSLRQLERNLWQVDFIQAYPADGDTWTAHFQCVAGPTYITLFETREALWDYVHRRVLAGTVLAFPQQKQTQVIASGNKGNYPWKSP